MAQGWLRRKAYDLGKDEMMQFVTQETTEMNKRDKMAWVFQNIAFLGKLQSKSDFDAVRDAYKTAAKEDYIPSEDDIRLATRNMKVALKERKNKTAAILAAEVILEFAPSNTDAQYILTLA